MSNKRGSTKRIAVVSDFHAFDSSTWKGDPSPSYFDIDPIKRPHRDKLDQSPIADLVAFIERCSLTADVLVCPGDLCDRACSVSLPIAWAKLHEIGAALKVDEVFATTGNHDVDSRWAHNPYDPIEALKTLSPMFPVNDQSLADQFWARHFFVHDRDNMRVVVLNSSAYHTTPSEVEHGRIADLTLKHLEAALDESPSKLLNVLLCHHNPHTHSEFKLGEADVIKGGQHLLDLIASVGDWLVVHGHKHHPKLSYASGGSSGAVVFSAGSVASTLYPELATETGNQFYIIEIYVDLVQRQGLVGRFKSWDWHKGFDWRAAESHKGLPAIGGFGHRESPRALAGRIVNLLKRKSDRHAVGEELYRKLPELRFVSPLDLASLATALESFSAICAFAPTGEIAEVAIV